MKKRYLNESWRLFAMKNNNHLFHGKLTQSAMIEISKEKRLLTVGMFLVSVVTIIHLFGLIVSILNPSENVQSDIYFLLYLIVMLGILTLIMGGIIRSLNKPNHELCLHTDKMIIRGKEFVYTEIRQITIDSVQKRIIIEYNTRELPDLIDLSNYENFNEFHQKLSQMVTCIEIGEEDILKRYNVLAKKYIANNRI